MCPSTDAKREKEESTILLWSVMSLYQKLQLDILARLQVLILSGHLASFPVTLSDIKIMWIRPINVVHLERVVTWFVSLSNRCVLTLLFLMFIIDDITIQCISLGGASLVGISLTGAFLAHNDCLFCFICIKAISYDIVEKTAVSWRKQPTLAKRTEIFIVMVSMCVHLVFVLIIFVLCHILYSRLQYRDLFYIKNIGYVCKRFRRQIMCPFFLLWG